ncbi:MAG: sugar phosphate isomerase/epimerase family protein [bacterium]
MRDFSTILAHISYHAVYDDSIRAALEWAAENGFSGVQVAAQAPHFRVTTLPDAECERIRSLLREKNLRLTLHAHDENVSLFECHPVLREGILNYYRSLCDAARRLGATIVTIHLGAPPTFSVADSSGKRYPEVDLSLWQKAAGDGIKDLVGLATDGPLICIENVNLTPPVREVLQPFLDRDEVALCWDIAKCYDRQLSRDTELEGYLTRNLRHVRHVHLHDIDSTGRSHHTIGEGVIDFKPYFKMFAESEILDYCIEVRPREAAKVSLDRLREMLAGSRG